MDITSFLSILPCKKRETVSYVLGDTKTPPETTVLTNGYQKLAMRTKAPNAKGKKWLSEALMGLAGECGEAIDILKKNLYQGHPLDRKHLISELGDVAWYLAAAADALHINLSDIFDANIEKLRKRYPDGFTAERSVNREENKAPSCKLRITCYRSTKFEATDTIDVDHIDGVMEPEEMTDEDRQALKENQMSPMCSFTDTDGVMHAVPWEFVIKIEPVR